MTEKVRAHVIVSGRVQGVFFRAETKRAAERFGASGWVRNRLDGTVEAILEGTRQAVDDTIAWCHHGPPMARVGDVKVTWENYVGDVKDFVIQY